MQATRDVPFKNLPGQSGLYLDYLNLSPGALSFYQRPPTIASLDQFAREDLPRRSYARPELASILERQNAALGAGDRTFEHIRNLNRAGCVAVVTGQQVGLFLGPLYTIYKALAAIRIAESLRAQNIQAVPVFWMECEDHDLAEVTHGTVIGADSALRKLDFRERLYGDTRESARPVGTLVLPAVIREITEEYANLLPDGGYKKEIGALLESAYRPGAGFADAFGILMTRLFRERGLIFFNPADRDAKRLVMPLFQEVLRKSSTIQGLLAERSQALRASGFHSQVSILENSTVLFLREKDERRALMTDGSRFALKNTTCAYAPEELLRLAEQAPERFSPNVLLRPLVQDYLFPTVAYVGGPAEVAYFAQIEVLYRLLDRPMPAIWPRAAFTLLEPEVVAAMEESRVQFADCFQGRQFVTEMIMEQAMQSSPSARTKDLGEELDRTLTEMRPELVFAEASLGPALDTARRKMLHNIEALHAKMIQLEAQRNGRLAHRADLILNYCYPNKNLQEREFGAPVFLARHGLPLLDVLYSEVRLEPFVHRVIAL